MKVLMKKAAHQKQQSERRAVPPFDRYDKICLLHDKTSLAILVAGLSGKRAGDNHD